MQLGRGRDRVSGDVEATLLSNYRSSLALYVFVPSAPTPNQITSTNIKIRGTYNPKLSSECIRITPKVYIG